MPCFYPLDAWQTSQGDIHFYPKGSAGKSRQNGADYKRELTLPCGRCIGCRLEKSRQWAIRMMHEAQMHEENSFITLTYNDDNVPFQGQLIGHHFTDFMKRLRYHVGKPIRYYMCGEYGEDFDRPHFHACVFGHGFYEDRLPLSKLASGGFLFSSERLDKIWEKGFCSVGELTFESAAYCARYVTKKVTGDLAESHYLRVDGTTGEIYYKEPEFARMSLKPGIGATWLEKYKDDVYNFDHVVVNGMKLKAPRFYDNKLEEFDHVRRDLLEVTRLERRLKMNHNDNTYERLRVREEVAKAKLSLKVRSLK